MKIEKRIDSAAETIAFRPPLGRGTAGQLRVRARIARTGVLTYPHQREYRSESEVFDAKSLATLEGAPVVLPHDHRDFVTSADWKRKSVGHVTDVSRDGDFILGTLVISDGDAIDAVERGELVELSAGYLSSVDPTPGTFDGESYDVVQRSIKYNHVALLPRGAARAGRDVRILRSDALEVSVRRLCLARVTRDAVVGRMHIHRFDSSPPSSRLAGSLGGVDDATRSVRVVASTPNPVEGEALVSWDTSRFERNPVCLWAHDSGGLPIGVASEIEQTPEGLKMRVQFASEKANPLAEQVFQAIREGIVRAVSVGFEPGPGTERGDGAIERKGNVLLEVSFVPIPADEDAGTEAMNPAAAAEGTPSPSDDESRKRFFGSDPDPDDEDQKAYLQENVDHARAANMDAVANACRATTPYDNPYAGTGNRFHQDGYANPHTYRNPNWGATGEERVAAVRRMQRMGR